VANSGALIPAQRTVMLSRYVKSWRDGDMARISVMVRNDYGPVEISIVRGAHGISSCAGLHIRVRDIPSGLPFRVNRALKAAPYAQCPEEAKRSGDDGVTSVVALLIDGQAGNQADHDGDVEPSKESCAKRRIGIEHFSFLSLASYQGLLDY